MREIIGTMTIEDIYRGRGEFDKRVRPGRLRGLRQDGPRPAVVLAQGIQRLAGLSRRPDQASHHGGQARSGHRRGRKPEGGDHPLLPGPQGREVARLQAEALIAKAQWENEAKKAESQVLVNQKKAHADFAYEIERNKIAQELKLEEAKVRQVEKEQAIKVEELEIKRRRRSSTPTS